MGAASLIDLIHCSSSVCFSAVVCSRLALTLLAHGARAADIVEPHPGEYSDYGRQKGIFPMFYTSIRCPKTGSATRYNPGRPWCQSAAEFLCSNCSAMPGPYTSAPIMCCQHQAQSTTCCIVESIVRPAVCRSLIEGSCQLGRVMLNNACNVRNQMAAGGVACWHPCSLKMDPWRLSVGLCLQAAG